MQVGDLRPGEQLGDHPLRVGAFDDLVVDLLAVGVVGAEQLLAVPKPAG